MHRGVKNFPKDTTPPSDSAGIRTLRVESKPLDFPSEETTYNHSDWGLNFYLS